MSSIKQPQIASIFNACKPTLRKDSGCAQFLLPYILVYVLCNGSTGDRLDIVKEVEAIIGGEETDEAVATLNGSILAEQKRATIAQDLDWMAKQTIFSVLDHMNKWLRIKYWTIVDTVRNKRQVSCY